MKGLSATNLWRMRAFYLAYSHNTILPLAVGEIGWSHNNVIIEKCKDLNQRNFYIHQTKKYGWTKNILIHQIENKTYEKIIINQQNFEETLPDELQQNAITALKDDYTFDFMELGNKHSEYQLEQAILNNIRKFLIEMGGNFTFVGNQYVIELNGKDYKIDLLLFHRELQSLIAIDLKVTEFIPEYAGKMNFYLSLLNEKVKKPHENPSIGIIICKSKDRTTVEFALRDVNKPIGIATYSLSKTLPIELKQFFPSPEELINRIEKISNKI